MKTADSKKLFQQIISAQDRLRILAQITSDKSLIHARVNNSTEFKTQPIQFLPPNRMQVESPSVKLGIQSVTVQFDCREERYFSKVDLAFEDWKLFFIFQNPLFRLQRRQYQRLKLPEKYVNRVLLMNVNDELWNEECEALDISLGGCSLSLSYRCVDIPVGAVLMLDIQIGNTPSFILIGQVCYRRLEKIAGKNKVKIGVQFRPHPKYSLQIQTVVQDLAAEIFSVWSQRKS